MSDIVDDLEHYARKAMPHYPNDICSRAKTEIERLRDVIEDAINTLEAMDLYAGNPLYNRLVLAMEQDAALEQSPKG